MLFVKLIEFCIIYSQKASYRITGWLSDYNTNLKALFHYFLSNSWQKVLLALEYAYRILNWQTHLPIDGPGHV